MAKKQASLSTGFICLLDHCSLSSIAPCLLIPTSQHALGLQIFLASYLHPCTFFPHHSYSVPQFDDPLLNPSGCAVFCFESNPAHFLLCSPEAFPAQYPPIVYMVPFAIFSSCDISTFALSFNWTTAHSFVSLSVGAGCLHFGSRITTVNIMEDSTNIFFWYYSFLFVWKYATCGPQKRQCYVMK